MLWLLSKVKAQLYASHTSSMRSTGRLTFKKNTFHNILRSYHLGFFIRPFSSAYLRLGRGSLRRVIPGRLLTSDAFHHLMQDPKTLPAQPGFVIPPQTPGPNPGGLYPVGRAWNTCKWKRPRGISTDAQHEVSLGGGFACRRKVSLAVVQTLGLGRCIKIS